MDCYSVTLDLGLYFLPSFLLLLLLLLLELCTGVGDGARVEIGQGVAAGCLSERGRVEAVAKALAGMLLKMVDGPNDI